MLLDILFFYAFFSTSITISSVIILWLCFCGDPFKKIGFLMSQEGFLSVEDRSKATVVQALSSETAVALGLTVV